MNNSMVAHLWANEKEESARGSNLFFEGRSIYPYGYHFRMELNSYQVTFESCDDHYQIYGRDIQDVMGGVTGGAGVYG